MKVALDTNNPYSCLASPRSRQVSPKLVRDATYARTVEEEVPTSFKEAEAVQDEMDAAHLLAAYALEGGWAEE